MDGVTTAGGAGAMSETDPGPGGTMGLPQGDLGLLESGVARRLLGSTVPARVAYRAMDGTPRVVPTWFHWTGDELVMATFLSAPHVRHAAARLRALRANPDVAITVDTEGFPPQALLVRGRAAVTEVDGVVSEYASAARRYMGEEAAAGYLAQIDRPGTRMARIAVRPRWVGVIDFETRLPSTLGGVTGAGARDG
jgi:Pyridoxamine 5'-phosphate oxidase